MKKILSAILALAALVSAAPLRASDEAAPAPTKCPVSGEKLGEMGKPYVFTYEGKEVQLCCSGCKKSFDKDPSKYVKAEASKAAAQ